MIPAASSRGLSDGGSGVGKSVACNDSRLCTSSCCLCGNRWEYVVEQMKDKQGVTEQLKAENQMLWVGKMNNIIACAEEIVVREVVYV